MKLPDNLLEALVLDEEHNSAPQTFLSKKSQAKTPHRITLALILNKMAVGAQQARSRINELGSRPPLNDQMLQFQKQPYAVYVSRDLINHLMDTIRLLINQEPGNGGIYIQKALLDCLSVLNVNLASIEVLRIPADQFLAKKDHEAIQNFLNHIEVLKPLDSSEGKESKDLTREECLSIHIAH